MRGGGGKVGQVLPFDQPLICHWRGAQRQRDQAVARGVSRRGSAPLCDLRGGDLQRVHQAAEAVLGVILKRQRIFHLRPNGIGQVKVKAGQHDHALVQARHGAHQRCHWSARSG